MRDHLIVVVPGIGGSVLARPGDPGNPVWSVKLRDLDVLRHPEKLSLDEAPELEPVALISSLKMVRFWTAFVGYEDLLEALGAPAPTVLAVPYDFRLGVEHAARRLDAQVRARLHQLWPGGDHHKKVIVVAHSLGGLVARYWLAPGIARDEREKAYRDDADPVELCRSLITLGTPHRGAPKALDVLANGLNVLGRHTFKGLRDVLRTWPSMAQLLPRYRSVVDSSVPNGAYSGELLLPHELPLSWGVDAKSAYDLHERIEQAWKALPLGIAPQVIPRIGFGHGTLRSSVWDGKKLTVSKKAPPWPNLQKWNDDLGDGTVPAFSGLPLEMDSFRPDDLLVRSRHGHIGALNEVAALVRGYEQRQIPLGFRSDAGSATLGLDLPELMVTGEALDVSATIRGIKPHPGTEVWATVRDADEDRRVGDPVLLRWDMGTLSFRGQVGPLAAGGYTIEVNSQPVAGVGTLNSYETIEVVDDAELD